MINQATKFGLPPLVDLCDLFGGSACPPSSGSGGGVPYPHDYGSLQVNGIPIYAGSNGTSSATPCPQGYILQNGTCFMLTANGQTPTATPTPTTNILQSIEQFAKDNPVIATGLISLAIILFVKKK